MTLHWTMADAAEMVYPRITKDPRICSGRACVQGTRVRVLDVVSLRNEGRTPEEIANEFTSLSGVEDVYAALLYDADHKAEIDADFADEARIAAENAPFVQGVRHIKPIP